MQQYGFEDLARHSGGNRKKYQVLQGFTDILDTLLKQGISNSSVCLDRLRESGYPGSLTTVKRYIAEHRDLIPAKRQLVAPQGSRGRRYHTGPGECYQMDWGFVNVDDASGRIFRVTCFAMICHHCGQRYIEFFTNAKQENLFIGMIHGFEYLGIPKTILTDNMKSVVTGRDENGHPIWQVDYEQFMQTLHFETRLCRPRHPFTKGKVERLVRFVKDNFLAGRTFHDLRDLNEAAIQWCNQQNNRYHAATHCIPADKHWKECRPQTTELTRSKDILYYLSPLRRIAFDGFVEYEGHRYGVPYSYTRKACRIQREADQITIYDDRLTQILVQHRASWDDGESFCEDQYVPDQPEEHPTADIKTNIHRVERSRDERSAAFDKFDFLKGGRLE